MKLNELKKELMNDKDYKGVITDKLFAKPIIVSRNLMRFLGTKDKYETIQCLFYNTVFGEVVFEEEEMSNIKDDFVVRYIWNTGNFGCDFNISWDINANTFDIEFMRDSVDTANCYKVDSFDKVLEILDKEI